jgi:hypothetical protein
MKKQMILACCLILGGFVEGACAQGKTSAFSIDFSNPELAQSQAEALQGALTSDAASIALELTIKPEIDGGKSDYHVVRHLAKNGAQVNVKCDTGWERFGPATSSFDIVFGTVNTHLILTVLHAGPLQAPFHTVACEYDGDETADFVIRGTFAKSIISIPTADDVELRPVNP